MGLQTTRHDFIITRLAINVTSLVVTIHQLLNMFCPKYLTLLLCPAFQRHSYSEHIIISIYTIRIQVMETFNPLKSLCMLCRRLLIAPDKNYHKV